MSAYIAPLPQQLRDQVVTAYKNHEGGYQALGERFGVATATVRNWVRQARHNGDETLLAVTLGNQVPKTKIDEKGRVFLHLVIEQAPEITILDLVAAYKEAFGIEIAEETMRRCVRMMGYAKPARAKPSRAKRAKRAKPAQHTTEPRTTDRHTATTLNPPQPPTTPSTYLSFKMLPDHTPGLHKVICNDVALINAVDLGALLGYANNGSTLPLLIRKNWGEQLIVDQDFLILRGAELDHFQSACADVGLIDFCKHQQQAFLLTPSGVHFVLSRSQKPLNPALRTWLLGDELQRIENQICSALGPEPEPRADHFAWHTTRDLLVRSALLKGPFESASSRMMALIQRKHALDAWLQWHFKHDRITEASFLPVLTMFEAAVNLMCGQLPACAPINMALGGERLM